MLESEPDFIYQVDYLASEMSHCKCLEELHISEYFSQRLFWENIILGKLFTPKSVALLQRNAFTQ